MAHHVFERDNFKRIILQQEPNLYEDILKVFETFQETDEHLTINEIQQKLKEKGIEIDEDTLKQYMSKIVELGFATKKEFKDQPTRYEHRHLGIHHDHLICIRCGKILEFEDQDLEALQEQIARRHGFNILHHRMEIYGICKDCREKISQVMPLTMARPGERYFIKEIVGGRMARLRLFAMGLRPGDEVEIISDSMGDGIILARGETRLAIGKGIAQKIMVSMKEE